MKPFDLPPNPIDWLHVAALCRPAEVRERESYLSNPPDAADSEHFERLEQQQPQALDEPIMPSFLMTPPQQYQYRRDASMIFAGVGMMDDIAFPPSSGSKVIATPPHGQHRSQAGLFPGVPE